MSKNKYTFFVKWGKWSNMYKLYKSYAKMKELTN